MMPEDTRRNLDRMKEMKVKVPARYHLKLHSMKILTGKGISDTVVDALEAYFSDNGLDGDELLSSAGA